MDNVNLRKSDFQMIEMESMEYEKRDFEVDLQGISVIKTSIDFKKFSKKEVFKSLVIVKDYSDIRALLKELYKCKNLRTLYFFNLTNEKIELEINKFRNIDSLTINKSVSMPSFKKNCLKRLKILKIFENDFFEKDDFFRSTGILKCSKDLNNIEFFIEDDSFPIMIKTNLESMGFETEIGEVGNTMLIKLIKKEREVNIKILKNLQEIENFEEVEKVLFEVKKDLKDVKKKDIIEVIEKPDLEDKIFEVISDKELKILKSNYVVIIHPEEFEKIKTRVENFAIVFTESEYVRPILDRLNQYSGEVKNLCFINLTGKSFYLNLRSEKFKKLKNLSLSKSIILMPSKESSLERISFFQNKLSENEKFLGEPLDYYRYRMLNNLNVFNFIITNFAEKIIKYFSIPSLKKIDFFMREDILNFQRDFCKKLSNILKKENFKSNLDQLHKKILEEKKRISSKNVLEEKKGSDELNFKVWNFERELEITIAGVNENEPNENLYYENLREIILESLEEVIKTNEQIY